LLWEAERTLPPGDPHLAMLHERVAERITFDDGPPQGAKIEGKAFEVLPAPGPIGRQNPVRGQRGAGLVNSFHPGDRGRGRILLPWRELDGSPIHFLAGGGAGWGRGVVGLGGVGAFRGRSRG